MKLLSLLLSVPNSMVSKLSNLIIFGIIIVTNGNPRWEFTRPHFMDHARQPFLQQVDKDAKSNYEDNSGKNRNDLTKITYEYNGGKRNYINYETAEIGQEERTPKILNLFLRDTDTLWNDTKPLTANHMGSKQRDYDNTEEESNSVNNKAVLKFLNYLDKTLQLYKSNLLLACKGNDCGENREDDNQNSYGDDSDSREYNDNIVNHDDRHLRCNGKRCSVNRNGNDINNKDNLHYDDAVFKDITRILRSNSDDNDIYDIGTWRCTGDRCTWVIDDNRSDGYDDKDDRGRLRCVGDRCGINRDDDARNVLDIDRGDRYYAIDDRGRLRCIGSSCGINRDDDDERNVKDKDRGDRYDARDDRYGDNNVRSRLLCVGNRCGRNREDDDKSARDNDRDRTYNVGSDRNHANDDRYNGKYNTGRLLCVGNRCGRSRDDYDINVRDNDKDRTYIDLSFRNDDRYEGKGNRGSLLCVGNNCDRSRHFNNDKNVRGNDRDQTYNDRSSINNANDYRYDDKINRGRLLCIGNKCARSKDNDYDKNVRDYDKDRTYIDQSYKHDANEDRYGGRDNRGRLLCVGNNCDRSKDDDYDKNIRNYDKDSTYIDRSYINDDRYDGKVNSGSLLCVGNNCDQSKDDDNDKNVRDNDRDQTYNDRSDINNTDDVRYGGDNGGQLLCVGNRCARNQDNDDRNKLISHNFNVSEPVLADVNRLLDIMRQKRNNWEVENRQKYDKQFNAIMSNTRSGVLKLINWHYKQNRLTEIPHTDDNRNLFKVQPHSNNNQKVPLPYLY